MLPSNYIETHFKIRSGQLQITTQHGNIVETIIVTIFSKNFDFVNNDTGLKDDVSLSVLDLSAILHNIVVISTI